MGRESREEILERCDVRPIAVVKAEQEAIPPRAEYVEDSDLQALIHLDITDVRVAQTARRLYWRFLNHSFRDDYRAFRGAHKGDVDTAGNSATFPEYLPRPEQIQNMEQLVQLLETLAKPNWLEVAEVYRELGDMDAAQKALNCVMGEQQRLHLVTEKLIALNVRGPVRFSQ